MNSLERFYKTIAYESVDRPACWLGDPTPEEALDESRLREAIEKYLDSLNRDARIVFVCRYFYGDPEKKIAADMGCSLAKVKSSLHRTRAGLSEYLRKEGYEL